MLFVYKSRESGEACRKKRCAKKNSTKTNKQLLKDNKVYLYLLQHNVFLPPVVVSLLTPLRQSKNDIRGAS